MKEIKLVNRETLALVDDEDFDWLNQWRWRELRCKRTSYATTEIEGHTVSMHRLILNCEKELQVDHVDHDGLNNQRSNIRKCTKSENLKNSRSRINSSSKYLGVSFARGAYFSKGEYREYGRYRALIKVGDEKMFLGAFIDEVEAAMAYDVAALRYHKEFANLNFPAKKEEYLRILEENAVSVG